MTLQPQLIAPFVTGLDTYNDPWLAPPDSFTIADNVHVYRGRVEKRQGYRLFGEIDGRVMGICTYTDEDGATDCLAFDTTKGYKYNTVTKAYVEFTTNPIFDGGESNYIWCVQWQAPGLTNRLYFTNGKAYDGVSLNGIRYYDGGSDSTSFVPALNSAPTRWLYGSQLLFTLKGRLIALNTFEYDSGSGTTSTFPQRARWCQAYGPSNWNDTTPGGGGYVDAPTGDQIVSARALLDQIIVYFTNSVWTLVPRGDPAAPFQWVRLNNFRACDGKMASVGYDRHVNALGIRGITASDGVQTQRIDNRIQNFVNDNIDADNFSKVFCSRDYTLQRWWTLFPSSSQAADSDTIENDRALVYDDVSQAFTTYSISLNCLGSGVFAQDFALSDFAIGTPYDLSIDEVGDATLGDYFWQANDEIMLGGDISGNVYVLNQTGADNGASIDCELFTAAWNPFQVQGQSARFSYLDLLLDADATTEATIEFYKDSDQSPYATQDLDTLPDLNYICSIQDVTNSNPAVVTAAQHGLTTGQTVYLYQIKGMDGVNGEEVQVTVISPDAFSIPINTTSAGTYVGGGQVCYLPLTQDKVWKRVFAGGNGYEHRVRLVSSGANASFIVHAWKPYFYASGRTPQ